MRSSIVVDIGNTGLKAATILGQMEDGSLAQIDAEIFYRRWKKSGLPQSKWNASDLDRDNVDLQDRQAFHQMVDGMTRGQEGPTEWWISSVQSTALDQLNHAIQQTRPHDRVCVLRHRDVPMMLNIEFPERLGMDRLFAAWGAWIAQGRSGAVIVVQVGTALTMDFVDARGVFQGGTILPGVPLALQLLASGTDLLPWVSAPPDFEHIAIPGKNTEQAMLGGVSASLIGGVRWIAERYREQASDPRIPIVASGGDSPSFSRWLPEPARLIDQLVLRSIATLALKKGFS